MNPELQNLRTHYELLPAHVQARKTAQSLLRAIQIAELSEERYSAALEALKSSGDLCARITKQEGQ